MDLAGRTAVVTGGASGIGAAVGERLGRAGAKVVVWDLDPDSQVPCDVGDPAAVGTAMVKTLELAGTPTILVACAGIGHSGALLAVPPAGWDQVLNTNLTGAWLSMRAVAGAMVAAGEPGSMVAITSVSARLVDREMGAYCVSKAGLEMLVRIAAYEWAEHGIRVNAVGPGVTDTPMLARAPESGMKAEVVERTPFHRLGKADDIAQAVVALLGLDWVTGQVLLADGGLSLYSPIDMVGASERAGQR
ncbi:MAG TPA: SDR family oxidoreductase [Acidimicrobiales bacterium]|nr:SDR family oxidoreductase [Acidimicrobiales bacterium]